MRYVGSNIAIDGNPLASLAIDALGWDEEERALREAERYELRILELIAKIGQMRTGLAVLRAIHRHAHLSMVIKPYMGSDVNAKAKPADKRAATPKGRRFSGIGRRRDQRGTGLGSDTEIQFTPALFLKSPLKTALNLPEPPNLGGGGPEEILLHEMVHGLRHMAGWRIMRRVPFQPDYDTISEFYSIFVTNIYRSERGRKALRIDHRDTPFQSIGEKNFLRTGRNRAHLRQFRRQQTEFFSDLRRVKAPFNPTRLLLEL